MSGDESEKEEEEGYDLGLQEAVGRALKGHSPLEKSSKERSQGNPRVEEPLVEACQVSGNGGLEKLDGTEHQLARTEQGSSDKESDEQLCKKLDESVDSEILEEKDVEIPESEAEEERVDRILSDRDRQEMTIKRQGMIVDGTVTVPELQLLIDTGEEQSVPNPLLL
jgi:hypothetical protein